MWGIWGRPTSPLEGLAILGSVVQMVAGISLIAGARWPIPTVIGLLLTWSFYAPALVSTARAGLSQIRAEPSAVIPSLLLVSASALRERKIFVGVNLTPEMTGVSFSCEELKRVLGPADA